MDQVKQYLGIARKYHFWILAVVVIATGVGVWMKASGALAARYDQDLNTITTAEKGVQGLNSPDNPNPQFTKKVEGLHEGLKKQVFDAWQKLYERQVALFTWPELELKPTVDLNRLRPDEEIPEYVRVFYNERVIQPMWTDLLEEVKIRQPKKKDESDEDADDSPRGPNQNRAVEEYEGLVVWKPAKRQAIISRYLTENGVPSSAKVRLIQEDYWMFESLIKVINAVNEGATDSLKAPIKEIDTLDVAQWAVAASLESGATIWTKSQAASGASGGMGMGNPMGMGGAMSGMGGSMGMTGPPAAAGAPPAGGAPAAAGAAAGGAQGGAAANSDADWFEGRFLDEKGQPLKGNTHPFAEFRQMFVFMKLIMDQRRIPDLIAACANADLPIETRQVRVQLLQRDAAATAGGGLFGDGGGFGPGGMGPGGMGPGGMGPGGMGPGGMGPGGMGPGGMGPVPMGGMDMGGGLGGLSSVAEGGVETTVFDVVVELSGVIYLYNPPDIAKLGTGAASAPEKRSFGVPTSAVKLPVAAGAGAGGFGPAGAMPMGGGMTPPNPMGR